MRPTTLTNGVNLREFFPQGQVFGGGDLRITSCSDRLQCCRPGDLFVAIETAEDDGHLLAAQAVQRGAKAILAERFVPVTVPVCVVDDSRAAYGRLCQRLVGDPSAQMRTFGVTGTNGKTITSWLIASLFRSAGERTGVISSLAHSDGTHSEPAFATTPNARDLADWLGRMRTGGCSHAVVEMTSRALAERRTAGVEFDAVVLTNLRRDHLDYHGSVDNYRRAKLRALEHLKPHGAAVVNVDDPASKSLLRHLDCPVLTVGMRLPGELNARVIERYAGQQTFLLSAGTETVAVQTRMFGDHHVYNCLSAAAVGLLMGLDLTTVARGLEALPSLPGRMEPLACGQPFGVYVDSARTPDALAAALRTLRQVTSGRVLCVFGADARRDPSLRPLLGRIMERGADLGVITNDNPRWERPLHIAHDIIDGYQRPARAHVYPDRAEAIRWVLSQARPGDAVLVAGKGHQTYQIIQGKKRAFDDREVARTWLYEVGSKIDYQEQEPQVVRFRTSVSLVN